MSRESIFRVNGMTCQGCRKHVEEALAKVEGVDEVVVDLDQELASIKSDFVVTKEALNTSLEIFRGRYTIHSIGEVVEEEHDYVAPDNIPVGVYYCPMQCEGDKSYDQAGSCPICGMDLVFSGLSKEDETLIELERKFKIALVFTVPIFFIAMSEMIPGEPFTSVLHPRRWNWIQFLLSLPVVFYACWMFFERAWYSFRRWNLNMFSLIGLGAGVAWLFSLSGLLIPSIFPEQFLTQYGTVHVYFEAATVILTLVLLGQLLEAKAHGKTNKAIQGLLQLAPNEATRITDHEDEVISISSIRKGDLIRVKPGEKVPVDGIVVDGNSNIDESMLTGESIPVYKESDDDVIGGTINKDGSFVMRAEKIGAATLLSQIIHMVDQASRSRAPIQKLVDRIAAYFVPIVIIIAILTSLIWYVWGPHPAAVYALVNGIAVLIIACPCALGLATPMSVMVGVGKGAQSGILIKNAEALEKMNKVNVLVIDKTGTITEGKPSVEKIVRFGNEIDEVELTQIASSLNLASEHPLAQAVVKYSKDKNIRQADHSNFKNIPGKGISGFVNGKNIIIGNRNLMIEREMILSESEISKAYQEQEQGKTVSFIAVEKKVVGYIVYKDEIKDTSIAALKKLKDMGVEIIMLTGDNDLTAAAVGEQVGISNFKAEMLPKDKLEELKHLQFEGHVVAMAGDGVNDAPALAGADVSIAMGTGTDIAMENSDITLVKGDLLGIYKSISLSKKVMENIKQNLFFALVYNTLGIPIAAGVLFPIFGILLSPMIAAAAMSFSSVSVIANALRLNAVKI